VFLFFLFFIAGRYFRVLLIFNGGTARFIGPWLALIYTGCCCLHSLRLRPKIAYAIRDVMRLPSAQSPKPLFGLLALVIPGTTYYRRARGAVGGGDVVSK
jgi:hypothetical protein